MAAIQNNQHIRYVFDNLIDHEFIENRKVSTETTLDSGEEKPIIELQPNSDNSKLILKFIRSRQPDYTLDDLMMGFFCYARENGYPLVGLEDDALFADGDCKFRALTFRVFQNKKSIYAKFGYVPTIDISPHLTLLNQMSLSDSLELLYNLKGMKDLYEKAMTFGDGASFSDFITSLDCETRRTFLNRLDELALNYERNKTSLELLNAEAKNYLLIYREYVKAHGEMTAVPECNAGRRVGGFKIMPKRRTKRRTKRSTKRRTKRSTKRRTKRPTKRRTKRYLYN